MPVRLQSRIPEIIVSLPVRAKAAMGAGAEGIAAEAKQRVPVATGRLRDAIHVEPEGEGFSVVAGNNQAFYGHIVENGSVNTPAHPFLIPAAENQKDAIAEAVTVALRAL